MPSVVLQYWWGADTLFELQENRLERSCYPDNLLSCMSSIIGNEPIGKESNYLQVLMWLFLPNSWCSWSFETVFFTGSTKSRTWLEPGGTVFSVVMLLGMLSGQFLASRKLFHHLPVSLAHGTADYFAKLIDGAVADAVIDKETLPALLNYSLFCQNRQVFADICLTHCC